MCSLCIAPLRGQPIGGQDRDGASYRCSAPYTLCLFEAFPSRGNEKIGGTGYCVTYDTESQSRNADFISIAAERQSATLGAKGPVKLKNPWAEGPSILRTFPFTTLLHNPRAGGPSTLTPAGRVQRCVQSFLCPT